MSNPAITAALIAASRQQEVEEAIEGRLRRPGHRAVERHIAQPRRREKELLDQAMPRARSRPPAMAAII